MTLIHTPRVLWSVGKGLMKNRRVSAGLKSNSKEDRQKLMCGILPDQPPHVYHGHAGLFDVDYLGHMNNASSLTHAEYARWEWTAESGMLQTLMKSNTHFMVASAGVRFRRQIRPIFRKFEVQTRLSGIDDTSFWVYQTFRYPEADNDRIRTQVLIKGVATRGRNVIPPRTVLEDLMDIPSEIVDGMMIQQPSFPPTMNDVSGDDEGDVRDDESKQIQTMLTSFQQLDESFRGAAGADDAKR